MVILVNAVLVIILLIFIAFYGTDLFINTISNLKRYHIGRWSNYETWLTAAENKAIKWLKYTPTVKQTDNYQYVLLDIIKGRYRNPTIQSWQTAGLVLGLMNSDLPASQNAIKEWKYSVINSTGDWKQPVEKVDFAMLAYALLKVTDDPNVIKSAMDCVIKTIENNLCSNGIVSYSSGNNADKFFVDTLGMICPFLVLYGKVYNCEEYIHLSVEQIRFYTNNGLLGETMLPCHAIAAESKLPLGVYGWGRGTAWYILGLLDTYLELEDSSEKQELKKYLEAAAKEYKVYQDSSGGFNTILQGGGTYDSSVTAVMAYFYNCCSIVFNSQEYYSVYEKCIERLMNATMKDGAIDQCQGDTHGIGCFSQVFDIMPFAQGMALRGCLLKNDKCD